MEGLKKSRQGHFTVVFISYAIQSVEKNVLKLRWRTALIVRIRVNPQINWILYTSEWTYPFVEIATKLWTKSKFFYAEILRLTYWRKRISPLCIILERARCDCTFALVLAHMSHSMDVYMCVCVEESDLVGLHPAGGLLYDIKLDEGESSALTWTPPSAVVTEQWQQQHNNNAVRG